MINLPGLNINRIALHRITAKSKSKESKSATVEGDGKIVDVGKEVKGMITQRLVDSMGNNSKSFELEIEDTHEGSFFNICETIKIQDDTDFLNSSLKIANLLAGSQTQPRIPGGFLLVMDCTDTYRNMGQYIVIKIEPHDAMEVEEINGAITVKLLKDIFFSPSQRLYKIGILAERLVPIRSGQSPNEKYECYIFDDNFTNTTKLANYFSKGFLGFTAENNSKIQTKLFYSKTQEFIHDKIKNFDTKSDAINSLRSEIRSTNPFIKPIDFAKNNVPAEFHQEYIDMIHDIGWSGSIKKDNTLVTKSIDWVKMPFKGEVNVVGKEADFWENVSVLSPDDLANLRADDPTYTLIKINGKPFTNGE